MQHAQKMILVNPETLSTAKDKPVPSESVARTRLDQELKDILNRVDLEPYDKLQQYNQVLQRYLTYYNSSSKQPMTLKILHDKPKADPPQAEDGPLQTPRPKDKDMPVHDGHNDDSHYQEVNDTSSRLMANFPVVIKKKADTLLDMIKNSKGLMNFNESGELLLEGNVISGTHISDLIYDVLMEKAGLEPKGSEQFLKGLARLNVPERLIRNKTRRATLRNIKQISPSKRSSKTSISKVSKSKGKKTAYNRPIRKAYFNWESY